MSEVKQVTPEELQALKAVRDEIDNYIISLGQIQYQRVLLESQEDQIKKSLIISKVKEKEVSDMLSKKYGNVSVDIETGIIS
jgi:hypothetical protein